MVHFPQICASAILSALFTFGILFLWGSVFRDRKYVLASLIGTGLFCADIVIVYFPAFLGASGLTWAWLSKSSEIIVFGAIYWFVCNHTEKEISAKNRLRLVFIFGVLFGIAVSIPGLFNLTDNVPKLPSFSFIAYQATMPGIAEEIFYRGLLLLIFDRYLGRPIKFLGVYWGWGAILSTVVFYFGHALTFDAQWNLLLELSTVFDFGIFGIAMCWLAYRFENILPCAIAHNVHNCLSTYLAIGVHHLLDVL